MQIFLLFFLFLFFFPEDSLAWGIGVHLQLGTSILGNLHQIPPGLAELLAAYPEHYLYGCVSADITLAKKFTHYLQHCHSWRIGKKILAEAGDDSQKACAYGYLAHLAADCVAHSYYVPYKVIRTFNTNLLGHAYWELRFEAKVPDPIWKRAAELATGDFTNNDAMLRRVLSDTIFSFRTNKKLFDSLLLLNRLQQWQKMIRSMDSASKWALGDREQQEYLDLAETATLSILNHMEDSDYYQADPTGERALTAAKVLRRNLNLLWLDDKLPQEDSDRFIAETKEKLKRGITNPERLLDFLTEH
jgi:hypothetical protein